MSVLTVIGDLSLASFKCIWTLIFTKDSGMTWNQWLPREYEAVKQVIALENSEKKVGFMFSITLLCIVHLFVDNSDHWSGGCPWNKNKNIC